MLQEFTVKLSNLLLSLSDAIEIANSRIACHQMRTAFLAWKIAEAAKLPENTIGKIYLGALLHDIGALSLEEKVQLLEEAGEINLDTHCILGEAFYELSPILAPAAKIVRYHHTPWDSWNVPLDTPHVLESQIINLADNIERAINRNQYILHQTETLRTTISALAKNEIHPDLVDVFMGLSKREDIWLDLTSPRLYSLLLHHGPFRRIEIGQNEIFSIASVFRHIIDFKSRFTATHSTGVAECAVMLSRLLGFTEHETNQMEIAGYFHDLGKLGIPNSILEKPCNLTKQEFDVIKQHTYFTYTVLNTIGGLDMIAEWAAFHHEKLDGTGYPFHVSAERINLGARIMAVADIFTALAENRPYRAGMGRKKIEKILKDKVKQRALDGNIVKILLENMDDIWKDVKSKQISSRETFEKKFLKIKRGGV